MKQGDTLRAGDLNLLISLYGVTDTGDPATSPEALIVAGIPAAKRNLLSREIDEAGREQASNVSVFTIRYRAGVDTAKVLMFVGDRWDIDAIDDPNGSKRLLNIRARKVR